MDLSAGALLTAWFRAHARDLPWRKDYLPYHVWLSEVMLQQTQMERGVAYFERWITRFPSVVSVAEASEEEIFKYWEGLGYYRRARNLKAAAEEIVSRYGGELPRTKDALLELPGIGEYTAGALLSIAWNLPVPAVDANVERLFARLEDWDQAVGIPLRREIAQKVEALMADYAPREITQALMEFGALCCTPRNPDCPACPLAPDCKARKRNTVALRPVPRKKKAAVRLHRVAGIVEGAEGFLLRRRPEGEVLGGLWEFPSVDIQDGESCEEALDRLFKKLGMDVRAEGFLCTVRHSFTVHRVILHGYRCLLQSRPGSLPPEFRMVPGEELGNCSFHAGARKIAAHLRES